MLAPPNTLALRARSLSMSLAITFALVLAAGWWRLQDANSEGRIERHRPAERVAALERLSQAIVPVDQASQAVAGCVELENVRKAADARLAELSRPAPTRPPVVFNRYTLDPGRWESATDCRSLARDIDAELKRSWPLLLAAGSWRENSVNKSERSWQGRHWRPRLADIETPNAWALVPGCIRTSWGEAIGGVCGGEAIGLLGESIADPQLAKAMLPHLGEALRSATGMVTPFRGKAVPVGPDVVLALNSAWQERAYALVECFTGASETCATVLPSHLRSQWHFQPGMMRAGAAAVVVAEVRTGEVVAAAGAISDCAVNNLGRNADRMRDGGQLRLPLFRPGSNELCAQIPDAYGAQGFLTQSPVFWHVAPGSTMKTIALLAGIDSGVVSPAFDAAYRVMLAQSHDPGGHGQHVPQRIARQSAAKFQQLLHQLGFAGDPTDVLFGGAAESAWLQATRSGFAVERFSINEATFLQVQNAKRSGANADKLYGPKLVGEYLKAHRLGISAIGGGDIRHTAWGLADWGRRLALRAEGAASMPPTRLATLGGRTEPVSLDFAKPESVRRLLAMLSGATASKLGGTAAGSCRMVFGNCQPSGHPAILFAKTGTAETGAGGEASPWVKTGGAGTPPAKLFMMVFRAADGELYAAGAMTLRIRARPGSPLPELHSNSAAELSMLLAAPELKK